MKKPISRFFLFSLAALLSSCFLIKDVKIWNIQNVEIITLEQDGMMIEADVNIQNPNFFKIKVVDTDLEIFIEDNLLGDAEFKEDMIVEAHEDTVRRIKIKAVYKGEMSGTLRGIYGLAMGKATTITIKGIVTGKAMGIEHNYPMELKETIQI